MSFRALFFISSIFFVSTSSIASEPIYANAQIALTKPEQSTGGVAAVVAVGIPVPDRKGIFIEGQLSSTILEPKQNSMELSYTHLGGYGVYQRLFNEKFALHGKAGLLYQYSKIEQDVSAGSAGIAFAVGATIHHNRNISYLLELSTVQAELNLIYISAGIQYRFR